MNGIKAIPKWYKLTDAPYDCGAAMSYLRAVDSRRVYYLTIVIRAIQSGSVRGEMVRLPCRVAEPGWIKSDVYSISGRKIRGLIIGQSGSGSPAVEWDTRDDAGRPVPAGVYLVRFATGNEAQTVRVIIK